MKELLKYKDGDLVTNEDIFELECNSKLTVEDCGMSGQNISWHWYVVSDGVNEINLYVDTTETEED